MRSVIGREVAIELLKAMGCPIELCQEVSFDFAVDEVASVTIKYALDPRWLETAGAALKADDQA